MSTLQKYFRFALLVTILIFLVLPATAQDELRLTAGQPTAANITTPGESVRLAYTLTAARAVTLQALSQTVPPVLTVFRGDVVVAEQPNVESALIVTLDAFLPAGEYAVEVRAPQGSTATGSVFLAVQSDMPMVPLVLTRGAPLQGEVSAQLPVALYAFDRLDVPAYLYVDSLLVDSGVAATLVNVQTGAASASLTPDLPGARLTIPAGIGQYQIEISFSSSGDSQPFRLCLEAVASGECSGGGSVVSPQVEPTSSAGCFVTPNFAGGANIRQSTSTSTAVLIVLPGNATADVLGTSPDGAWYNVTYNGVTGWVALSAITANGVCSGLTVFTPPVVPTQIPPTPQPTVQVQPPTPSGPCVVRFNAPELVYTQPTLLPDWIYDQVPQGGEIIPTGRWNSDPSWYKTNYAGAWWQNRSGTAGVISGNCAALPLIPWP
jgi:hypothetical protein